MQKQPPAKSLKRLDPGPHRAASSMGGYVALTSQAGENNMASLRACVGESQRADDGESESR